MSASGPEPTTSATSGPALVVVLGVEEPIRVYSTATNESEAVRLELDLRGRSDVVRELLTTIFELAEEPSA